MIMLDYALYVLAFTVAILVVVGVHEWGHYIVARLCGVHVEVFSFGIGPKLFGYTTKQGTCWQLSLLPLGGYVKMKGEATGLDTDSFATKSLKQKAAIVAAGPVINLVFALLVIIGLSISFTADKGLVTSVKAGAVLTYQVTEQITTSLKDIVTGQASAKELGGVLTIAKVSGDASKQGLRNFIFLVAILSINLGIINLLPIPVLDGGHLFFYGIEGIRGKPLAPNVASALGSVGLYALIALMLFTTFNDLVKFVG